MNTKELLQFVAGGSVLGVVGLSILTPWHWAAVVILGSLVGATGGTIAALAVSIDD